MVAELATNGKSPALEDPGWLRIAPTDPQIVAEAGEALAGILGDAAASVDLVALAGELVASEPKRGGSLKHATRDEIVAHLVNAAVTRQRAAEQEAAASRPLTATEQADVAAIQSPEKLSAAAAKPSGRKQIRFRSARELRAELPPAIEWVVRFLAALGALTELVGRAKAAGKTTLLMALIRAVVDGMPFLGWPTAKSPVVILSEQPPASLRAALDRAGLSERDDVRLLLWGEARGIAWSEVVAAALAECEAAGAHLLIVDTLPAFAGIRGDAENDAGAALAAIEPLQVAAATRNIAIVVVRHERKGGGDVGDSGRGSSAFTGAVDIVVRLGRHAGSEQVPLARPTMRSLAILSRFDDAPDELLIELTEDGYVALGSGAAVVYGEVRDQLLSMLPALPGPGLAMAEIEGLLEAKRTTVQAALRELVDLGDVARAGTGRKGDPYRFCRVSAAGSAESSGNGAAGALPLQGEEGAHRQQPRHSRRASVGDRMEEIFTREPEPEDVDVEEPGVDDLFSDLQDDVPQGMPA